MARIEDPRETSLQYVAKALYCDHMIKIARRGDDLKVLIYRPGEMLASDIVQVPIADYESAIMLAKAKIDQSF